MANVQEFCSPVGIASVDTMAKKKRNERRSLMVIRCDGLTIMKTLVPFFLDGEKGCACLDPKVKKLVRNRRIAWENSRQAPTYLST